jgi:hypothetical protein
VSDGTFAYLSWALVTLGPVRSSTPAGCLSR